MEAHAATAAALQADDRIHLAVLFGSSARGTSSSQSDLDIGVLGLAAGDIPRVAVQLARVAGREVDLIDLASAPPLLRLEIARDGLLLFARPTYLWSEFRGQALIDWWDALADRRAITRELADRLREGVGLRNRIAHGYALLNYKRVRADALAGIPSLRAFLAAVGREAGV